MFHVVAVGIDEYADPKIPKLRCAVNDARRLTGLFQNGVTEGECVVRLLTNEQATREAIMDSVGSRLATEVERDDSVLIYFACHGSPEMRSPLERPRAYLIASDTRSERIYASGIDLAQDLTTWFERLDCRLTVMVLDTCFSGAGGRSFLGPHLGARADLRDLEGRARTSLKDIKLGRGKVVLAACGEDETAEEDPLTGHGVFTRHLLRELAGENAQTRPTLGVASLYERLSVAVAQDTDGRQTPVLRGAIAGAQLPVVRAM